MILSRGVSSASAMNTERWHTDLRTISVHDFTFIPYYRPPDSPYIEPKSMSLNPMISTFSYPNRIIFGPGAISRLPELLTELSAKRVLLVTDEGLVKAGLVERVQSRIDTVAQTVLYTGVTPNPTEACVDEAAEWLKSESCDLVIGLGGGSAMDAAKAAALRENHHRPFTEYEIQIGGDRNMTESVSLIIAIPTTAGTGSEVGRSAVITLAEGNRKAVICGPKLLPHIALCDPELTLGLPPHITAATGMDALTHNIEAYLSTAYHPICDAVALGGIRLAAENLERAVKEGADVEARSNMMLSSSMGAIAFQKDLGAAHSMAHPLSTAVSRGRNRPSSRSRTCARGPEAHRSDLR